MHISEGVLSVPVLVGGAVAAAAGVAVGLRKLDYEQMPRVAMLSSVFFVASLIHVPIGPSSVHLVLNGLVGVVLGWLAFPALLVALFLQAILFGFGGPTALGANTVVMAAPAVVCYHLFRRALRGQRRSVALGAAFAAGALGIALGCLLLGLALFATGKEFLPVVGVALAAHVPVMVIEGFVTASVVAFLRKVCPELLDGRPPRPGEEEAAYA